MGKLLDWLKDLCCSSPQPLRFRVKCASACCKGEVVQVVQPMRQRAHTI